MISIVTPSLNQGAFLEAALTSVLTQDVELEYVVIDGGSSDGSVEIIRRFEDRLAAWRSEPDDGQYDAINKGFALTSGEIMAWLNADDFYLPGCLSIVEEVFRTRPEIDWITGTIVAIANAAGQVVRTRGVNRFSRAAFLRGFNLPARGWYAGHFLPQESTFWRRSLWERAGGRLDAALDLAGDIELWGRFYRHAELWGVRGLLGCYRSQPAQKTSTALGAYLDEAETALRGEGGHPYGRFEGALRRRLEARLARRFYRLPTRARHALEGRGLIYRAPELFWDESSKSWAVNNVYFV